MSCCSSLLTFVSSGELLNLSTTDVRCLEIRPATHGNLHAANSRNSARTQCATLSSRWANQIARAQQHYKLLGLPSWSMVLLQSFFKSGLQRLNLSHHGGTHLSYWGAAFSSSCKQAAIHLGQLIRNSWVSVFDEITRLICTVFRWFTTVSPLARSNQTSPP